MLRLLHVAACAAGLTIGLTCTAQSVAKKDSTGLDIVTLKNGDRISGDLLNVENGALKFDGDKTGTVSIDLGNVAGIVGVKKVYRVDIINTGWFTGHIGLASRPGYFVINDSTFDIRDITSLVGIESKFIKRIDGSISLGYTFSKSSAITRFNVNQELEYTSRDWHMHQGFSTIYTVGDGNGAERITADVTGTRFIRIQWLGIGAVQYQRMLELGVNARYIALAGLARRLLRNRHVVSYAGLGVAMQKEYATDGTVSDLQTEIPLFVNLRVFQLKKPDLDLSTQGIFYYNLTINDRYRVDYKINLSYEMLKDLVLSVEYYYNFDSKPLSETTTSNSDYGTVVSVGYKF